MTTLYIRDVPDSVAAVLKQRAAENGQSLSTFIAFELAKLAARPGNNEVVARLRAQERVEGLTPERILREVHNGRR